MIEVQRAGSKSFESSVLIVNTTMKSDFSPNGDMNTFMLHNTSESRFVSQMTHVIHPEKDDLLRSD